MRRDVRWGTTLSAFLGLVIAAAPTPARSQEPPTQPPDGDEAFQLFEQGRAALEAKSFDQACTLFEKSYVLGGSAGALLSWADCEESRGQLKRAFELWQQGEAKVLREPDRLAFAKQRRTALELRVPVIQLSTQAGSEISLDGQLLKPETTQVRVDPGTHTFDARFPSGKTHQETVTVKPGDKVTVRLLEGVAQSPKGPAQPENPGGSAPPKAEEPSDTLAIVGWSLIGVGGAGTVAFAVTGGLFLDQCGGFPDCAGVKSDYTALGDANLASLIVGGVGLGVGATLLIVDATSSPEAPTRASWLSVTPVRGGAGLQFGSNF